MKPTLTAVFVTVFAFTPIAYAQTEPTDVKAHFQNQARQFTEAFNRRDWSAFEKNYTEDAIIFETHWTAKGPQAITLNYRNGAEKADVTISITVNEAWRLGDTAWSANTWKALVRPKGKEVALTGHSLAVFQCHADQCLIAREAATQDPMPPDTP